jgi:hypothetical protein
VKDYESVFKNESPRPTGERTWCPVKANRNHEHVNGFIQGHRIFSSKGWNGMTEDRTLLRVRVDGNGKTTLEDGSSKILRNVCIRL